MSDTLLFLRSLLARPRSIGAIAPSSRALARAMAMQIRRNALEPVLELGPGTGIVTQAILARGIAPEHLTVIEYDPAFARLVAQRFPAVRVINGDAFALAQTLAPGGRGPFAAILSGIPLLNFTEQRRQTLINAAFDHLLPHGVFVQFSYGLHAPVGPPPGGSVSRAAFVLFNAPPARVWVYRKT